MDEIKVRSFASEIFAGKKKIAEILMDFKLFFRGPVKLEISWGEEEETKRCGACP